MLYEHLVWCVYLLPPFLLPGREGLVELNGAHGGDGGHTVVVVAQASGGAEWGSWGHSLKLVASATVRTAGIGAPAPGRDLGWHPLATAWECWQWSWLELAGGILVGIPWPQHGDAGSGGLSRRLQAGDGGHTVRVLALASDGGHSLELLALASVVATRS